MWRLFALGDEGGTVICSYPDGANVPAIPIPYCEETMTGFEYAFAGLLIAEGYFEEGERVVKAVRDRYDGEKRNPFNEIECGSNNARSMASFALLPLYSGFTFDMPRKHIGFAPLDPAGSYLFSVGESWGNVRFDDSGCCITVLGAPLALCSVAVPESERITAVTVDGKPAAFTVSNGSVLLQNAVIGSELCLFR